MGREQPSEPGTKPMICTTSDRRPSAGFCVRMPAGKKHQLPLAPP
jgi:hypothetical protein